MSEPNSGTTNHRETALRSFGFERLGVATARYPWVSVLLVAILCAVAAFGLVQIRTDDTLRQLFHSGNPAIQDFIKLKRSFPASGQDVLVVAETGRFRDRATFAALNDMHFELSLVEGVSGTVSLFAMRQWTNEGGGIPPPLIPERIPDGAEFQRLLQDVEAHPLVKDRLVSPSQTSKRLVLYILSLQPKANFEAVLAELKSTIRATAIPDVTFEITGIGVQRLELAIASKRDRLVLMLVGFAVGLTVCWVFFRRFDFLLLTNIAPGIAVWWTLGLMGFTGATLNPVMNAILPLLLVITFTNGMHLAFEIRSNLVDPTGSSRDIVSNAVRNVGPACFLSALTTLLAFLSIAFADSPQIREFGLIAAAGSALSFIAVMTINPPLAVFLFRNTETARQGKVARGPLGVLQRQSVALADLIAHRFVSLSVFATALFVLVVVLHLHLAPHYRLSDMAPSDSPSQRLAERIEETFGAIHPVQIMLQWRSTEAKLSDTLPSIVAAHKAVAEISPIRNVWSVATLMPMLQAAGSDPYRNIDERIAKLPKAATAQLINMEERAALITAFIPDLDAKEIGALKQRVVEAIAPLVGVAHGITLTVSGSPVMAAAASTEIISQLNTSLSLAIVIVTALMVVLFRSTAIGLLSLIPNLFALAATGACLFVLGWGLEYAGVIALTVAFGLAIDDTIHVFNRYRLEGLAQGSGRELIHRTIARIGPILMLTTIVLVLGIAASATSQVPPTRTFGIICMMTLCFALVGDLILLPALMFLASRLGLLKANGRAAGSAKSFGRKSEATVSERG